MLKKSCGIILGTLLIFSANCFAMTFTDTVKIGTAGFPAQAPYRGFIIIGETHNTGAPYLEPVGSVKTYIKGEARYGEGESALYCDYDFEAKDFSRSISFGGKNNPAVVLNGDYKDIIQIPNSDNLPLYAIYHKYGVTELNIIGKRDGKWVRYINSKELSKRYFNGKDAYKEENGIIYDQPIAKNDCIIIKYRRWHWSGESAPEGEFRLKWDDRAKWFSIDQIMY